MPITAPMAYDVSKVTLTFAGRDISGFESETTIDVEPTTRETTTQQMGLQPGEVGFSINPDRSAMVNFSLMQGSPSNAYLQAQLEKFRRSGGKVGLGPVLIRDASGNNIHAGAYAWVASQPVPSYGKELTVREWSLFVSQLETTYGG